MIIRTEDIKKMCTSIIKAIDNTSSVLINDLLEITTKDRYLFVNVTNKEYFVTKKFFIDDDIVFHVVIRAEEFLKLVPQFTTETISLSVNDNLLCVEGDGKYHFPIIFDDDKMIELPKIEINNIIDEFDIETNNLHTILLFNSKELYKYKIISPISKYYYFDQSGVITCASGACVNNFNIESKTKFILTDKIVRLFKLFNTPRTHVKFGHDDINGIIYTKIQFEDETTILTAIINNDDLLISQMPVQAIRSRLNDIYSYSIDLNKETLFKALNRLSLFNKNEDAKLTLHFNKNSMIIENDNHHKEIIDYVSPVENLEKYQADVYLLDIKTALDCGKELYTTLQFGNHEAFIISHGSIKNIIPECED